MAVRLYCGYAMVGSPMRSEAVVYDRWYEEILPGTKEKEETYLLSARSMPKCVVSFRNPNQGKGTHSPG